MHLLIGLYILSINIRRHHSQYSRCEDRKTGWCTNQHLHFCKTTMEGYILKQIKESLPKKIACIRWLIIIAYIPIAFRGRETIVEGGLVGGSLLFGLPSIQFVASCFFKCIWCIFYSVCPYANRMVDLLGALLTAHN